jgi:signal transduction histidine kinase
MWYQISLRGRLFMIVTGLIIITLTGGGVMMWYTYQMDALFTGIINQQFAALQAAEALENALVSHKGFVSYYFMDGNPEWLEKLGKHREAFKTGLNEARQLAPTKTVIETLDRIEFQYDEYIQHKDKVISLYKNGERDAGADLHKKVRAHFFTILELCRDYKDVHSREIHAASVRTHTQARRLRLIAGTGISIAILLGALLVFVLMTQIFNPLRQLALDENPKKSVMPEDEVKAVSNRVQHLMEDVDQTKTELARSQDILLKSEKLAVAGRLAAGTAHSIRNPLTSVKMRLFSISRMLDLPPAQKEDLDVISGEIRHIEGIVQNFLEFSRPPKLKKEKVNPSDVVDASLRLLNHRLRVHNCDVKLDRKDRMPDVMVDPGQLQEVFVNVLVNACEATGIGGQIVISEQVDDIGPLGKAVVISVSDSGPGISKETQEKLFDPFFSTKEEGTGLGLSIAARIVEEHGGRLHVESQEGKGAIFAVTLPCQEA